MGDNEYTERLKLFKEYEEVNCQLIDVVNTKIIELKAKGKESQMKLDEIIKVVKRVIKGTNKLIGSITSRKIDKINESEFNKVITRVEVAIDGMDSKKIADALENDMLNFLLSYRKILNDILGGSLSSYVNGSMLMDEEKFIDIFLNPIGLQNSIDKGKKEYRYN